MSVPVTAKFHFGLCEHPSKGYIQLAPVPLHWHLLALSVATVKIPYMSSPMTSRVGLY